MKRGPTGRHERVSTLGEAVRAFVPAPLPPAPPLVLEGGLAALLERATLALGRLDSVTVLLPEPNLFLYAYIRREAVVSSQIEGTQSSLSDLLLFEIEDAPGVPFDDVVEVSNYVGALEHGLQRLRGGFPLSSRLIREVHGRLLARGRGKDRDPGEFRRSQNWIGGTRPGNAQFVPPPPQRVAECMGELECFLHADPSAYPVLVQAALAHVQFETIHPFLDGNGRVGRLLIVLLLAERGTLTQPLLYLSLFFKQHRDEYYRLLDLVRREGDWEAWLSFFLEGVEITGTGALTTARRLVQLFGTDSEAIRGLGGRITSNVLRVHDALRQRPVSTLNQVAERAGISFPTAAKGMAALVDLGIARELTGGRRNRIFAYGRYLDILNEGAEPL